jgi:GNAT superfamily N-acetyltransferase
LAREELTDFLHHPSGSAFGSPEMHRAAISQLEGLPYEGKPGYFPFPVSGRRLLFFHRQVTDIGADGRSVASCDFYERIRSPNELISSMQVFNSLSDRGIQFWNRPQQLVAVTIFPSMFDAPDGIVPMPEDDERSIGDYIVMSLGYRDKLFVFLNNWGPEWGIEGAGAYSIDYVKRYWREVWSVRGLTGPHPELGGSLGPSSKRWHQLLAGSWDEHESTNFFAVHYGTVVDVFGRWLIGVSDGSMWLQCIAVLREAEARPLIVGWMHIRGTSDGAEIEELFVWPPYRKRGIATTLTGQALLYAAGTPWQHGRWRWHELEADVIMRQRSHWEPRIPSWLDHLLSDPDSAVTNRAQFLALLERLAKLQSLDGVRLLRDAGGVDSREVDYVVDDDRTPAHGVVLRIRDQA